MAHDSKPIGEVDPLVGRLGKLRPIEPLRSDPFETFYQAGYQAALASSEKPSMVPSFFRRSYPFAFGGLAGAALTTVLMWVCLRPFSPAVERELSNPSLATLRGVVSPEVAKTEVVSQEVATPEVMSSKVVSSEVAPPQVDATDKDRAVQTDGTADALLALTDENQIQPGGAIASFIDHSFGKFFRFSSDSADCVALTGLPSEMSKSQMSELPTIKALSRQTTWQPLWSAGAMQVKTPSSADLRKDMSSDSSRPSQPSATIWQLRQHPDLLAL